MRIWGKGNSSPSKTRDIDSLCALRSSVMRAGLPAAGIYKQSSMAAPATVFCRHRQTLQLLLLHGSLTALESLFWAPAAVLLAVLFCHLPAEGLADPGLSVQSSGPRTQTLGLVSEKVPHSACSSHLSGLSSSCPKYHSFPCSLGIELQENIIPKIPPLRVLERASGRPCPISSALSLLPLFQQEK